MKPKGERFGQVALRREAAERVRPLGRSDEKVGWEGLHRKIEIQVEVLGQIGGSVKHYEIRPIMLRPNRASTAASPSRSSLSSTATCALIPPPAAASWQACVIASGKGG